MAKVVGRDYDPGTEAEFISGEPNNTRETHSIEYAPLRSTCMQKLGKIMGLALALMGTTVIGSPAQTPDPKPSASQAGSSDKTTGHPVLPQPGTKEQGPGMVSQEPGTSARKNENFTETSPVSNSDLESYIDNCLKKDPTLSGTSLHVAVSGDRIELSGNVAKAKEKQTAGRIALSFAGNKKLVNQITIGAPAASQTPAAARTPAKGTPENQRAAPSLSAQPDAATPPPMP